MHDTIQYLTYEKQLDRLKELGVNISPENEIRAIHKLETIGYYKLKRFAYPLMNKNNPDKPFYGIEFDNLVLRYYQDKNLRIFLLHAIEKIEVSVKVSLSNILGRKYGAFGYKNFSRWTDLNSFQSRKRDVRFSRNELISKRREAENKFCYDLRKNIRRSSLPDLADDRNLENDLPSIWLATDVLMFGDLVYLLRLMAPVNIRELAEIYGLNKDEFLSWMSCLNFVRNLCAHNSNIIDLRLKTTPQIKDGWKSQLYKHDDDNYTNRIALVLFIIKDLTSKINTKYKYRNISNSMHTMIDYSDIKAKTFGYKDASSFYKVFPRRNKKKSNRRKKQIKTTVNYSEISTELKTS